MYVAFRKCLFKRNYQPSPCKDSVIVRAKADNPRSMPHACPQILQCGTRWREDALQTDACHYVLQNMVDCLVLTGMRKHVILNGVTCMLVTCMCFHVTAIPDMWFVCPSLPTDERGCRLDAPSPLAGWECGKSNHARCETEALPMFASRI